MIICIYCMPLLFHILKSVWMNLSVLFSLGFNTIVLKPRVETLRSMKNVEHYFMYQSTIATCKLLISIASASKSGYYFPIWLEDKYTACFVVHYNNMSIAIHRNTFWPHKFSWSNFCLGKQKKRLNLFYFYIFFYNLLFLFSFSKL